MATLNSRILRIIAIDKNNVMIRKLIIHACAFIMKQLYIEGKKDFESLTFTQIEQEVFTMENYQCYYYYYNYHKV